MIIAATESFGADHLPYGSFSTDDGAQRLGVRFGDTVFDLAAAARKGLAPDSCDAPNLNRLLARGPDEWAAAREAAVDLAEAPDERLAHPIESVTLHLPIDVADYVDFYSSEQHATNVGRMFRPDAEPLLPNWRHLPVGYHGRAGTIVVSGTPIARPRGQRREADGSIAFGPSQKLDIELELGVVLGNPTVLGQPVAIDDAGKHIFGVALINDWSARDIQAWEYLPLGPFLGKSFATTMAAWITPMAALDGVRVPAPRQDPEPLPYLTTATPWSLDLDLEVTLTSREMRSAGTDPHVIAATNFGEMYWTIAQQLAHLTVNGATIRAGDLFASGTISGSDPSTYGSLLELAWNGTRPLSLPDGSRRTFLEDGDEIVLRGGADDLTLGEAAGTVVG